MTLEQAIKVANGHSSNANLKYYVHEWNSGYAIAPQSFIDRHNIPFVYCTGDPKSKWIIEADEKGKRTHLIKLLKK